MKVQVGHGDGRCRGRHVVLGKAIRSGANNETKGHF